MVELSLPSSESKTDADVSLADVKAFFEEAERQPTLPPAVSLEDCQSLLALAVGVAGEQFSQDDGISVADVKSFFSIVEGLLLAVTKPSLDDCQALLDEAEAFLLPRQVSVDDCRVFLTTTEGLTGGNEVLPTSKMCETFLAQGELLLTAACQYRVNYLLESDPRKAGDFKTINILEVFGVARKEKPHSRFLAWLLDPGETHGLAARFLVEFLKLAQRVCDKSFNFDTHSVTIQTEKATEGGMPDIVITGPDFLCVVENKILAVEGQDQTKRYAKWAEEKEIEERGIPNDRLLLVFLTPTGREAQDSRFRPMSYEQVVSILEGILHRQGDVEPETRFAIEQFVFSVRDTILRKFGLHRKVGRFLDGYSVEEQRYLVDNWQELWTLYGLVKGGSNGEVPGIQ